MENQEKIAAFKRWYDSIWLSDENHGQKVPQHIGDDKYTEYMAGYTLALGAWMEATRLGDKVGTLRRKIFVCLHCEGMYADQPVAQCDCMEGTGHDFVEGVAEYQNPKFSERDKN